MPYPSKRTPEVIEAVLEGLREGVPLAEICRRGPEFPHPSVWRSWCAADEALANAYAAARDDGFDKIALETLRIADTPVEAKRVKVSADGTETVTEDALGHRKLQIDTRRWLLARWDPKRYGDRVMQEHTGEVGHKVDVAVDTGSLVELAEGLREAARAARGNEPAADPDKYV